MISRKRLIDQDAKPFLYQAIGDYQVEQARSTLGRKFRVGDLAQVVLKLFGALPLPQEDNVGGSLGRIPGGKTLVFADSPSKLTTASTLRRAQQYRDSILGGFEKIVVLGWNFSAGIGEDISALNDPRLEVLVIPADLLDRLKKKGNLEKLSGDVRFSSLQYLQARAGYRKANGDGEDLRINLVNYVLLSPDAIDLEDKNRTVLQEVMNAEPLALIEYWAVDPDYDGEVFRSVWQDYRDNTENDDDPLRVVTQAVLTLPKHEGPRRVCVRAVDVFGFESEVVFNDVEAFMMAVQRDLFPLATGLSELVDGQIPDIVDGEPTELLEQVTPVTAELIGFWFQSDYCELRQLNYHEGQRARDPAHHLCP